jgi:magnesium chelatase family protein
MALAEAIETTRSHRVAGLTGRRTAVITTRPCRAPHQPMADVGLIGGGQVPRPGEVSRAHSTSLGIDERSEWLYLLHHPQASPVGRISVCLTRVLSSNPWLNGTHIPLDTTVLPP